MIALLCAGAAKGLVARVVPAFTAETGFAVDGTFDAVGALVERLEGGVRCDVIVLSAALIARMEKEGRVVPGSAAQLGSVATAVAVPAGAPHPAIGDADSLRASLAGCSQLHFPDPERATAGIHFASVLRKLGLEAELASRCRTYANGAAAMAALAKADPSDIGCTQASEILYTPGVTLVGSVAAAVRARDRLRGGGRAARARTCHGVAAGRMPGGQTRARSPRCLGVRARGLRRGYFLRGEASGATSSARIAVPAADPLRSRRGRITRSLSASFRCSGPSAS